MTLSSPASDQSLRAAHDGLVALVVHLDAAIATANAAQIDVITGQIDTLNAQVTALGCKLFDAQTQQITEALADVSQAQVAALAAIKTQADIGAVTDASAACISKVALLLRLL